MMLRIFVICSAFFWGYSLCQEVRVCENRGEIGLKASHIDFVNPVCVFLCPIDGSQAVQQEPHSCIEESGEIVCSPGCMKLEYTWALWTKNNEKTHKKCYPQYYISDKTLFELHDRYFEHDHICRPTTWTSTNIQVDKSYDNVLRLLKSTEAYKNLDSEILGTEAKSEYLMNFHAALSLMLNDVLVKQRILADNIVSTDEISTKMNEESFLNIARNENPNKLYDSKRLKEKMSVFVNIFKHMKSNQIAAEDIKKLITKLEENSLNADSGDSLDANGASNSTLSSSENIIDSKPVVETKNTTVTAY